MPWIQRDQAKSRKCSLHVARVSRYRIRLELATFPAATKRFYGIDMQLSLLQPPSEYQMEGMQRAQKCLERFVRSRKIVSGSVTGRKIRVSCLLLCGRTRVQELKVQTLKLQSHS
jgi:hypothetical protein